jgi:hypothetical protein
MQDIQVSFRERGLIASQDNKIRSTFFWNQSDYSLYTFRSLLTVGLYHVDGMSFTSTSKIKKNKVEDRLNAPYFMQGGGEKIQHLLSSVAGAAKIFYLICRNEGIAQLNATKVAPLQLPINRIVRGLQPGNFRRIAQILKISAWINFLSVHRFRW